MVTIPTFNRQQTAKLGQSPVAKFNTANTGIDLSKSLQTASKAIDFIKVSRDARDEASATEKYNSWTENMSARNQELLNTKGSDAVDLSQKLTESSNEVINGIEFDNETQRRSFMRMVNTSLSARRSRLNQYEVGESLASLQRQKTVVMERSSADALEAVAADDIESVNESFVQFVEAHKTINPGVSEEVRVHDVTKQFSKSVSSALYNASNYNPTSAATNAFKMKEAGFLTEADYQGVISNSRNGYINSVASEKLDEIVNNSENNFMTVAELTGSDSEGADVESTSVALPYSERSKRVYDQVKQGISSIDQIYGNISEDLTKSLNEQYEKYKAAEDTEHQAFIENSKDEYLNLLSASLGATNDVDRAAALERQTAILADLREEGEFKEAQTLEDTSFSDRDSAIGAYSRISSMIVSGAITQTSQIAPFVNQLNKSDYDKLVTSLRGQNINRTKDDMSFAENTFKNTDLYKNEKDFRKQQVMLDGYMREWSRQYNEAVGANPDGTIDGQRKADIISTSIYTATGDVSASSLGERTSDIIEKVEDLRAEGYDLSWYERLGSADKQAAAAAYSQVQQRLSRQGAEFNDVDVLKEVEILYNVPEARQRQEELMQEEARERAINEARLLNDIGGLITGPVVLQAVDDDFAI